MSLVVKSTVTGRYLTINNVYIREVGEVNNISAETQGDRVPTEHHPRSRGLYVVLKGLFI